MRQYTLYGIRRSINEYDEMVFGCQTIHDAAREQRRLFHQGIGGGGVTSKPPGDVSEPEGAAFFVRTCTNCIKNVSWYGEAKDRPPCSRCGHVEEVTEDNRRQRYLELKEQYYARKRNEEHQKPQGPLKAIKKVVRPPTEPEGSIEAGST